MAARGGRAAAAAPQGPGGVNIFANDGSFLELFKRKMEAEQRGREAPAQGRERRRTGTGDRAPGESRWRQQRGRRGKRDGARSTSGQHYPCSCQGSYNGCSLLSLHPGGQAERWQQTSPEDRSGSKEAKD
nr:telomerase RNA component interacting RNase isoform X1 [Chelonoidis abingdonii]